ncbi:hypothetical protein SK128_000976 [Halocaridina rubra]|uniref:Uncharacterized protein n=1 Tax=Halocaridina rubra TaxID=373956 RepID=A0AAN8XHR7_HALRR
MLDDLKTTVGGEAELTVPDVRSDSTLVSSIRSTSRNEGRSSSRGGSRSGSALGGVEDGGHMKHSRREYRSPDNNTHVVTEKYEYDTGDTSKSSHFQKKVIKSTYSTYNSMNAGSLEDPSHLVNAEPPPEQSKPVNTKGTTSGTGLSNGSLRNNKYDADDEYIDDSKSGEVRRIVWRNRFEKTYETQDSSQPRAISIEEEARRRQLLQRQQQITSTSTSSTLSSPPQMSPGGQSWKDPIPLPTPPQLSPREPGVAYIYTYGNTGGTGVQPLPPLNYVTVPGPSSVPPSEGAPSPTPSQLQGQPIIYHYSYHYTIQPGQPLPDGAPPPPGGLTSGAPPALQMATSHQPLHSTPSSTVQPTKTSQPAYPSQPSHPSQPSQPSTVVNYNLHSHSSSHTSSSTVNRTNTTNVVHTGGPRPNDPYGSGSPQGPEGGPHGPGSPYGSICPKGSGKPDGPDRNDYPKFPVKPQSPPEGPSTNDPGHSGHPGSISITINKTTTTRTTHSGYPGEPSGPHSPTDMPPVTSTPYPSRGRSVSPEPSPYSSNAPQHISYMTSARSTHSDSLERVRRPKTEPVPFPDTSPIRPAGNGKIPRRIDDLMNSFSDSEDGPVNVPFGKTPRRDAADEPLLQHNNQIAVRAEADAKATAVAEMAPKRELTKNKAGPPVYYPPGHELFHETMHTMTLKESGRRGKAKWRMERAAGYKESSSSSETKGGVAMVPVCLPLCCGAACVIM